MLNKTLTAALLVFVSAAVFAGSQNSAQRYFDNSGGLIDRVSPFLIPEKSATSLNNITLDDRGQLSRRNPYNIINTTGTMGAFTVYGGGYHSATTGTSFVGVVVGTSVYRTGFNYGGTFTNVTSTVVVTNTAGNVAQTTNLNDNLIVCNELDKPFRLNASVDAVMLANAPAKAKTCAAYSNYLIFGNTTESSVAYPSRIRWSDFGSVEVYPANNYIDVEPNDGDSIVGIITYDSNVYIFKRRSIHQLIVTGSDGANAFVIRPVIRGLGAFAKGSIKAVPGQGIMFLGQNAVYSFNGETLTNVSDPIQRTIDGIGRSQYPNAVGGVYTKRNQYWLAVSTTSTTNAQVLVYDYLQQAWSIYSGMSPASLISGDDSTNNIVLLHGDYSGNVYRQDDASLTGDKPSNVATPLNVSYVTSELTLGAPEMTKEYKYLYVFLSVQASTTTVLVERSYDYSSAYESSATLDLGQIGAVYGAAIYGLDAYPSLQYKTIRIELNRSARSLRLRFSNSSSTTNLGVLGWVVIYRPEDWKQ